MFHSTPKEKPIAVITNACSGVGYEISKLLAKKGYDLILCSENPAVVETAQICEVLGSRVDKYILDFSHSEGVSKLYDKVIASLNQIDIIIFNANAERHSETYFLQNNLLSPVTFLNLIKDLFYKSDRIKILFIQLNTPGQKSEHQNVFDSSLMFIKNYAHGLKKEFLKKNLHSTVAYSKEIISPDFLSTEAIASICLDGLIAGQESINLGKAFHETYPKPRP
jgi:short-subunit dehydrogenase